MDANTSLCYNVMTKHEFGRWKDEMVDKTLFDGRVNFRVDGLMRALQLLTMKYPPLTDGSNIHFSGFKTKIWWKLAVERLGGLNIN